MSWIQTYSGKKFDILNPTLESICIEDIAHALSYQCRFSGHTKIHYSVAQHSVLVSYFCEQNDAFWGLMHDASEAYLVDVPRPIKHLQEFSQYSRFEKQIQSLICEKFGLTDIEPPSVKFADNLLLSLEAECFMSPLHEEWKFPLNKLPLTIKPLQPHEAEVLFLERFKKLNG